MATYDSPDLLSKFRKAIRMPSTSDTPTDAECYEYLGQGQVDIFSRLAVYAPRACIQTPTQLTVPAARTVSCTTTSGSLTVSSSALFLLNDVGKAISGSGIPTGTTIRSVTNTSNVVITAAATASASPTLTITPDVNYPYVATFGTDQDGNDLYPVGSVALYASLNNLPDLPMVEGVEYLMEGNKIRYPDNRAFTGTTPYFQCLVLPLTLTATYSPVLQPVAAREMIIDAAAVRYASDYDDPSGDAYERRLEKHWDQWIGVLQTQYARAGSIAATHPGTAPARNRYYGLPGRGLIH